jgi:hypothetical protein
MRTSPMHCENGREAFTQGNDFSKDEQTLHGYIRSTSTGQCPLFQKADSATHIMGDCPAHKALHIQRQDATGRCILKHIRKEAHGGFYLLADVGSMDKLDSYGITQSESHNG